MRWSAVHTVQYSAVDAGLQAAQGGGWLLPTPFWPAGNWTGLNQVDWDGEGWSLRVDTPYILCTVRIGTVQGEGRFKEVISIRLCKYWCIPNVRAAAEERTTEAREKRRDLAPWSGLG